MKAENRKVPTPSQIAGRYFEPTDARFYELTEAIDAHARNYSQHIGTGKGVVNSSRPGSVYILKNTDGAYKIGYSTSPRLRVAVTNTYGVSKAELLHTIKAPYMGFAEKYLHRLFREQHIRGEWFRLTQEQADWLLSIGTIVERDGEPQVVYKCDLPELFDFPALPEY